MSTTTSNLTSLSTTIAPIVGQSNAATAAGQTVLGTVFGGGAGGNLQTQGAAFNNTGITTVNGIGMTTATGPDSMATGLGATANGPGATAYGAYANADGEGTTAIGFRAIAKFKGSVAIGNQAQALADPSTAIGDNSLASGNDSVAVGASAQATAERSVAIGAFSVANQANTVSVGSPGNERRITNVASGVDGTDAANVSQVKDVGRVAYSGVAMSFAMSGAVMPNLEPGEKGFGVGLGNYKGYSAIGMTFKSLGASGDTAWGFGVSTTGKEWGLQLGIGFKWK